jgi:hypothetical protein
MLNICSVFFVVIQYVEVEMHDALKSGSGKGLRG